MTANYHSHTWRCHHAQGTEREYVEKAIDGGLEILGFSDHTPMPYPDGFVSNVKMTMQQLEGYVNTVLNLKEEYKDQIEIHLGLEAEYYPDLFGTLLRELSRYPIEYLLLGQHYLGNEIGDIYVGDATENVRILERYCRQCVQAMETGCFTYVAHPDVMHFTGDPQAYEEWSRYLCLQAKKHHLPLEINFLGIETGRHYPNPAFWKIAGETGNDVIFGADAHCPANVWRPDAQAEAYKMVQKYGLHLIEQTELISPFQ